eukprot:TRINITY_DN1547_c0_g1_i3.p1 TRINITY_DN1547_c0_g1~~TRINITY_DN1547_c0_g1_i3.p1  ORF type:complete len:293 (+),score=42.87 TRINITY_DN1547_c0_g1_i3:74-952(+)
MGFLLLSAFLMGTVLSNVCVALLQSLKLLFRQTISLLLNKQENDQSGFVVYEGKVWHQRTHPLHHSFEYNVKYAFINLDKISNHPLSSSVAFHHMDAQQARIIAGTSGPVYLLTIPTNLGYEQNPLSVYYCYEAEGSSFHLQHCIAEVTNTPWAERVLFLFNPNSDMVAKPLHVSPFMDMLGVWKIKATVPGTSLFLTIQLQHPEYGDYFSAVLKANKLEKAPLNTELLYWLMPHKVAVWIYWQAFKLWWKGVPFIAHPKYTTGKGYREEALKHSTNSGRWCIWKDSYWPWD